MQVHGRHAYEELIDRQLKLAAFFANWVRSSEIFELAAPQVLPIVNFRIKRAGITDEERRAAHEAIVHEVTRDGRRWISTTLVNGQSVIRMMVISYLTAHRHLEDLMIAVTEAAKKHASCQHQEPGRQNLKSTAVSLLVVPPAGTSRYRPSFVNLQRLARLGLRPAAQFPHALLDECDDGQRWFLR